MRNERRITSTAILAILGTLAFWSAGPIFIKALTGSLDSFTQNAVRYVAACGFALPFLMGASGRRQFDRRVWRKAIGPAVPNVLMQTLWAATFYYADPALVSLLSKTSVLWVAGFSVLLFAEERRLLGSVRFWAGLGLAITGVVGVLAFKPGFAAAGTRVGIALALGEAVFSALYTLSIRRCLQDVGSQVGFFVVSLYTAAALWVLALVWGHPGQVLAIGARDWVFVVISGVTAITLGHTFYYAAIKRMGAAIPALVMLAQPFGVLMLSRVAFGERMTVAQIGFGVLLLVGAAAAIWARDDL
ncbi:MAG: DMT family transporter [Phycisphaerae bacterium]|nr:DMT family transporter [Phycisphaerae bacterium]